MEPVSRMISGAMFVYLGVHGASACVIVVLRECILNVPAVSLVLSTYNDTGSLGSPPRQVIYSPG